MATGQTAAAAFLVYDLANMFGCPKSECEPLIQMCYDMVGFCPEYNSRIALVVGTDVHYDCSSGGWDRRTLRL